MSIQVLSASFGDEGGRSLAGYRARGGYRALEKALDMAPAEITAEVQRSNLRGRGGAGFPTGKKWTFVPRGAETVYLVCNADESEPGTCKDRELLWWTPHQLLEGMAIAALALGCRTAYVYVRGEMMREAVGLRAALDEAYAAGVLGPRLLGRGPGLDIVLHRGAGAYICGEETALLNSLEGRRGLPRLKPPFPALKGLFAQPTIVNNVETLCNLPHIIDRGAAWFAGLGLGASGGTRLICLSGHIARPGVYEVPMATTFRELVFDIGGGVPAGRKVRAVIPGGTSMPPLDADELDVPAEFDACTSSACIKCVEVRPGVPFDAGGGKPLRTMAGSGGVVVLDDSTDLPAVLARILRFYAHESCGQCTPCREGTGWLYRVARALAGGEGRPGDTELMADIAVGIAGNTICPLGDAAAWPTLGFLTKFRADFVARERRS